MIDDSIDISRVTYISDGKFLNATLWLRYGFDDSLFDDENTQRISFGMFIDVNPDPVIGVGGIGYHKEIVWPSQSIQIANIHPKSNNSWIEDIHEAPSTGGLHRYLRVTEQNYTDLFQHELNIGNSFVNPAYYIPLSVDLNVMSLPETYKVMFYTAVYDYRG
jgi:hypothetical protein